MKPVYVIGHKNPDVDSVAAAISYKVYKQSTDKGVYIAAAAGELKDELKKLLDHLEFEHPMILSNVGTTVEDLDSLDSIPMFADEGPEVFYQAPCFVLGLG